MKKEEYYSIPQLAEKLGMSRVGLYKKVKRGEIEAIKVGRSFAISKDYAKKYLLGRKGQVLKEEEKKEIDKVVKRVFNEYGEVIKKLGRE